MTKAPTSYIEAEIEIKEMMDKASSILSRLDSAKRTILQARDDLDRMTMIAPDGYRSLGDFLRTMAETNPGDPIWTPLAMRMNQTSAEFDEIRARIAIVANAVNE